MRIARFQTREGKIAIGAVADGRVTVIEQCESVVDAALSLPEPKGEVYALEDVKLLSPIARPHKILAIGLNYMDHVREGGPERPAPKFPMFFNKQNSSVSGPFDPIHRPRVSEQLDYEAELGVVIGRPGRHVPADKALQIVAGYVVGNDVTVRDWQKMAATFTVGKSFDTHCPLGPWLVTKDEIGDPHNLRVRTVVDGEVLQDFNTGEMLFKIQEQIAFLSTAFTLEPGDVILTGTSQGVGSRRTPQRWLRAGETVRVEIEGVGAIENPVIEEPSSTATW